MHHAYPTEFLQQLNAGGFHKRYRQENECVHMNLNNQQDDAWSLNKVSQFINKGKITNTHLKSKPSKSDFNWRCVYILRTNKNYANKEEIFVIGIKWCWLLKLSKTSLEL